MRKYIFLAFVLLIALNLGCVLVTITYPTMSDNTGTSGPIPSVNTQGKAHIVETSQTIDTTPNGDNAELVTFIDQDSKGIHHLSSYQIISTGDPATHFHSDTYCNPDWSGCSFLTETYDSALVTPGNIAAICNWASLGTRFNFNCVDIGFTGLCTTYRNQECGRGFGAQYGAQNVHDLIALAQTTEVGGMEALLFHMNGNNTQLTFSAGSQSLQFTPKGDVAMRAVPALHALLVDGTHPAMANNLRKVADQLRTLDSPIVQVCGEYEGISRCANMSGRTWNSLDKAANTLY